MAPSCLFLRKTWAPLPSAQVSEHHDGAWISIQRQDDITASKLLERILEAATTCVHTPLGTPFEKLGLHRFRHERYS